MSSEPSPKSETPSAPTGESRNGQSKPQPLYIRMYFRQHMTDVVRAFGYDELSREEARRRIEPLIERYGRSDIEAACAEIVEATPAGLWRLTEHARQLAAGMLGRQKPPRTVPPPTESPATADGSNALAEEQKKSATRASRKPRTAK